MTTKTNPELAPPPSVSVILVNWNGGADTVNCLASLLALRSRVRPSIVVVDNASTDDSIEMLRSWCATHGFINVITEHRSVVDQRVRSVERYEGIGQAFVDLTLVLNKSNLGFAPANNIGWAIANDTHAADYFWFLNNDTEVKSDCLDLLCSRMTNDPAIGICGSTLIHYGTANIVQAFGGVRYSTLTARGHHIGAGKSFSGPVDNTEIESQMTYVSGASMFVRREFIQTIGPMCEDYFLYNEEIDWAWRGRHHFRLGVETAAVVFHKEGASIGTETLERPASILSDFFQTRNKLLFALRHTPWFFPTVWCSLAVRTFKRWRNGQVSNALVMVQILFGRREPDPTWFKKRLP